MNRLYLRFIVILVSAVWLLSGCVSVPPRPTAQPFGIYHTVEKGQTLYRIAKTYGVDLKRLMQINKIVDPTQVEVGQRIFIPGARLPLPIEVYRPFGLDAVRNLVGPRHPASHWQYITLHHSATHEGNAAVFDRNHRHRGMGGLFYHFVIGNGTYSGDGEIEVGWRWRRQKEVNRPRDIQICLVGNFDNEQVSPAQFDAMVKLVSVLRQQYNIPICNIRRHKDIQGKITHCPGANFPFERLISELRNH